MRRASSPTNAAHGRELLWFSIMTPSEKTACVHRLVDCGYPDHTIAALTRLDIDAVRRIVAQRDL